MNPFRWADLVPMVPPPEPKKGPYRCPNPLDLKASPITPAPYVQEPPDPKHPYAMREGESIDQRMERFGYMKLSSGEYIPKEEMSRPHVPSFRARFALDCHQRSDPYENERQAVIAAVREDNERAALKRGW